MINYSSICLLAKDENEYINEWLNWHINVCKFDHIYIYDNEIKNTFNKFNYKYDEFFEYNPEMKDKIIIGE